MKIDSQTDRLVNVIAITIWLFLSAVVFIFSLYLTNGFILEKILLGIVLATLWPILFYAGLHIILIPFWIFCIIDVIRNYLYNGIFIPNNKLFKLYIRFNKGFLDENTSDN